MIACSHIWDALLKLTSLVALIIMAISLNLEERIRSAGIPTESGSVFVMIVIVGIIWLVLYRQYLSILSSWLYATMSLRTNISFNEAKMLRKLFQLDLSVRWLPLRDIKKLPKDQRHDAILLALNTLGPQRKAMLL